jgi:hypothetical protein
LPAARLRTFIKAHHLFLPGVVVVGPVPCECCREGGPILECVMARPWGRKGATLSQIRKAPLHRCNCDQTERVGSSIQQALVARYGPAAAKRIDTSSNYTEISPSASPETGSARSIPATIRA